RTRRPRRPRRVTGQRWSGRWWGWWQSWRSSFYTPIGRFNSHYPKGSIMSRLPTLTTTSYAILGLLAIRPWTTHELVRQVDRSLRRIWPRAQSKLYEEPKKLVAHGYAQPSDDP